MFFFCLMICMNKSFYAIIYPFIHKMYLSCYLRYILPSEIESFLKDICPSYSFHEGLGHDLVLAGLKYIYFLILHICCVCSHLGVIVKHFLQGHYLLIAYTKHSFMKT